MADTKDFWESAIRVLPYYRRAAIERHKSAIMARVAQELQAIEHERSIDQHKFYDAMSVEAYLGIIKTSGENVTKLAMRYNSVDRTVEPYRVEVGPHGALFWAYCDLHGHIESFRLDRIQVMRRTDIAFVPRWPLGPF